MIRMLKNAGFPALIVIAQHAVAGPVTFELLTWNDSQATPGLPTAVGLKPSEPSPVQGDWLTFTADDEQLAAGYNPAGALSHNLADILGTGGSGFNQAPSLSGTLTVDFASAGPDSWGLVITGLSYSGRATPLMTMNQFLVSAESPAAQNPVYQVDGLGNSGTWWASAANDWSVSFEADFHLATNIDGDGSPEDIDATFNDKPLAGYLVPVDRLTPAGMAEVDLDDPAGFYNGDFEQYLLDEIAVRLPANATFLLFVQMDKTNPGYTESGLPITTSSLIGNTTVAYTTQPIGVRPDLDGDGDVDGTDFLTFSNCFNGSLNPPTPICLNPAADIDEDGDVDGGDFLMLSNCFNGALNPPRAGCR